MIGKLHWNWACARTLVLAGGAAGFLSGLLGVGGGFILVPTLLAMSDLPMKAVVATSMGVVALVSVVGVVNAGLAGTHAVGRRLALRGGRVDGTADRALVREPPRRAAPAAGFAVLSLGIAASLLVRAAG